MTDEQKQANNLKRIETWKKKKALKAEIEAKKSTIASASPASLETMHEIQGHVLPKTKIRRDQSVGFKETRLVDEEQLKAAAVARLLLRLKECREDPIKFTEFVMKDPQGRNLVLKDFHKQWLKSFQEDNLVVVEASRNHGKCLAANTQVTLANGSLVTAEDLPEAFSVAAYDEATNSYVSKLATKADNGIQPTLNIKTKTGRECRVTAEHPFLTFSGYKDAKDLMVGDWIAAPSVIPELGKTKLHKDDAWLLGVLTGDAHVDNLYHVITTMDDAMVSEFYRIAAERNWSVSIKKGSHSGKAKDYSFINHHEFKFTKQSPNRYFVDSLKIKPVNSGFKRVPSTIFTASDYDICEFLAGYLDTDGSVNAARECAITYWSVSKTLLKDVQHLLLRIGIQSYLTIKKGKYKDEEHISWRLVICGYDNVTVFRNKIKPRGFRAAQLNALDLNAEKVAKGDLIPPEWRKYLTKSAKEITKLSGCQIDNNYATNRKKAFAAAMSDKNEILCKKISAPINWLKIEEITSCVPEQTYAIEVADLHNHITDDFITHNTSILVAYLLWSIGHNSNIRIKLFSQNDARAKERLAEVAANIETNEAFHLVFPEIKPKKGQWSNNRIVVERPMSLKDATLEALGITTSATGGRVDLIALDDVCDLNNSVVYPTVRERIIQKFTGELLPMLDPGGHVVSIATPYHIADLTATLKANPEFKHIRHVVGNDQDPLLPLWPERWDRPALQSLRIQQGAVEFDRAYRCLAFSGETVPCKPEWIKFYTKEELGDPSRMVCIQAYDLAIEQKSTSDYFACVTVLYDMERGKAFVADAKHERLSFSSQGHRIISNFLRWNPDRIIIEKVGLGGSLENYLNENSHIRLPLVPHKPKGDKYFRLMQQLHWLEDEKCTFHPNMDPAKQVLDEDGSLIKELLEFPVGRHDDLVDALTMALFALEEFRNHEAEAGWYDGGSMKAKMSVIG